MIEQLKEPFSDKESLDALNPYVREWFMSNFTELTPPQKFTFKLISEKRNVLVIAPTGSGKTMSGFLSIISRLFDYSISGTLENKVYCIYVSPLRSLNNDIYKNLSGPLEQIYDIIIKKMGMNIIKSNIKKVSVGVRTGDTSQQERRQQLLKAPNILVTTPESLAILINSEKFLENLKAVEYVIIDEVHELANNKRGVHLTLTIERLAALVNNDIIRIGLGATIHPLEEAAKFLVGYKKDGSEPRDCKIVDASWSKKLDVIAVSPVNDLIYTDNNVIENELYIEINRIIKNSKSTLIFTNTRSGTERVVFNLKERFSYGEDIAAHHSSLSKDFRFEVEELLKKGSLKCAVTSTSLELGVDIGAIENVIQLGSPKSVSRAIQRIGRAGHTFKATAHGEIIALDRDDLVECAVILDAALKKHLDSFSTPKNALDVLAQHIIGMSLNAKWDVDVAFDLIKRAYPYSTLEKNDFIALINYLAGKYVWLESRKVYGKIWYNENDNTFEKRGKLTQMVYMLNLGTIQDEIAINVFTLDKKWVGNIEEEFLSTMKPGDIFTLGGRLYEFQHTSGMKCYVAIANSKTPTIPPWFSEQLSLSFELANEIGMFREKLGNAILNDQKNSNKKIPKEVDNILKDILIDDKSRRVIYDYFIEQYKYVKIIPNNKMILIEDVIKADSSGGNKKHYLIFHALYGKRVNDALSRAFAIQLGERLDIDIGIVVNDNGFILNIGTFNMNNNIIKEVIDDLSSSNIVAMLKHSIKNTEIMKRRFRHVAMRGFMILKNYSGWKIGVGKQQFNSQALLKAIEHTDKNFPLLKETYREILDDMMDTPRAQELLYEIKEGVIHYKLIKTNTPSPFAHKMMAFGHIDSIMIESKHMYLQKLHESIMEKIGTNN
ncbi:MAG: ATP-dependent helicase [Candidatus Marsarchaeota archaeon]|nr:ATP-dependent helicase [Candidatus Marsarchaeota archaeon]